MKKSKANFYFILFSSILVLTFFSCGKDESILQEEPPAIMSSAEETIQAKGKEGNCSVDYDAVEINIEWAADCSTATITLSLCCECLSIGGTQTGCTLEPGVLEMQTEECPFDFYYYQQNIPWISIPEDSCYDLVFEIENQGCDVAFISQLWFNGVNLDFNYDSSQAICP